MSACVLSSKLHLHMFSALLHVRARALFATRQPKHRRMIPFGKGHLPVLKNIPLQYTAARWLAAE